MAVEYGNSNLPITGCVFYINGADRNCFVSGGFTGKQLVGGLETLTFQTGMGFFTGSGGYWNVWSPNRGINGSGSLAFSGTISFPNQFTHIMVAKRNDVAYETQGLYRPQVSSGGASYIGFGGTSTMMGGSNVGSSTTSTATISNNTDWIFISGKNELVSSTWTQSLYTRATVSGTRIYESKTTNHNWSTLSGSWTSVRIADTLIYTDLALIMSFNRVLSDAEIDTIYLSLRGRYNLPLP